MTGPVITEKLVTELAEAMLRHEWPNSPLVPFAEQDERIRNYWLGHARAQIAGPLAPLLAAHQQVTAERDEARAKVEAARAVAEGWPILEGQETVAGKIMTLAAAARQARLGERGTQFVLQHLMRALDAADASEASLATATSELARLRAEGEAKDRALKQADEALVPFARCAEVGLPYSFTGADFVAAHEARTALARAATAREG